LYCFNELPASKGFIYNQSPSFSYMHHEGIWEKWMYSPNHSQPLYYMEVSGQPHAPATLPLGNKSPQYQFNWRLGEA